MHCSTEHINGHRRMGCGCGPSRHFLTKKEKIDYLEKVKEELQKEVAGIDELIKEFSV